MKIVNLEIKNFLTVGEDSIELTLDNKGLCLLQGDNRDDSSAVSNGAGKSTIADAVYWCLFGQTARGETGDSVINNKVKKGCVVELVIEDEDNKYVIGRHRKHKTHKNALRVFDSVNSNDLTKGTDKLTQELLNKIIGCSQQVFKAAVYAGQESMPDLPGMTDRFLKDIVEEAAGIDRLSEAYDVAKKKLAKADLLIKDIDGEIRINDTLVFNAEDALKDISVNISVFEDKRIDEVADIDAKISAAKVAIKLSQVDLDKIPVASISDDLDALDDLLKSELAKRESLESDERGKSDRVKLVANQYKAIKMMAESKLGDIRNIQAKVGQPCGECGKHYHEDDLDTASTIAKDALREMKSSLLTLKSEHEAAKNEHEAALTALSSASGLTGIISSFEAQKRGLRKRLDDAKFIERVIDGEKASIKNLEAMRLRTQSADNPFKASKKKTEANLKTANQALTKAKADLDKAIEERDLIEKAVAVFGPAGVRAHVLDTVTPLLNDRTSYYLSVLSDGNISAVWNTLSKTKAGELRERFKIEVENDKGSSSFSGLSGGEKRKVRLATAMALQDLVAGRASKPIELWIADEIDDAMDDAGLERLMTVLEDKAKEKGTVLIISHNSLENWCKNVNTVIKESGFSRLEGDLLCR
ncbi:MAG: AAA family ATPase [Methylomicrobium sp.]|nr:AAA family ATPase [Methylomicrobium sp.]